MTSQSVVMHDDASCDPKTCAISGYWERGEAHEWGSVYCTRGQTAVCVQIRS